MKTRILIWIICSLLTIGCAAYNGRLSSDPAAAVFFLNTTRLSDHRYYYLNQENSPYAVAAVSDVYRITGPQWREFDPDSAVYEKVVGLVEAFPSQNYGTAYGARILDGSGQAIGYWYSSLRLIQIAVDESKGTIRIATDMPWVNDDNNMVFREEIPSKE